MFKTKEKKRKSETSKPKYFIVKCLRFGRLGATFWEKRVITQSKGKCKRIDLYSRIKKVFKNCFAQYNIVKEQITCEVLVVHGSIV